MAEAISFLSGYGLFKAVPTKKGDLLFRETKLVEKPARPRAESREEKKREL